MYYLDYAKKVGNRYVLNFFADTIEDLKDVPTTTAYVTRNGTNYGVPLDTSVVTIVEDGIRVNYVLQNGKYIVGGDIPPIVGTKTIIENGTYLAKDDDLEGYSSVTVEVPETISEEKVVELNMASGDQTISPEEGKLLNRVIVKRPETLIAENIKDGVNVGEIIGNLIIPTNKIPQIADGTISELVTEDLGDVKDIRGYAFYSCRQLKSAIIPNTVANVGTYAFADCTSLSDIGEHYDFVQLKNRCFSNCRQLTTFRISKKIQSSEYDSFENCNNLKRIDVLMNLKDYCELPDNAMKGLKSSSGTTPRFLYIDNQRLPQKLIIPEGTSKICNHAFYREEIINVTIPDSVVNIGERAFSLCNKIVNVAIPDSVVNIDNGAFVNCSALESVIVGNGVTEIGDSAFESCQNLINVLIGNSVSKIDNFAFSGTYKLASITIPSSVVLLGGRSLSIGSNNNKATINMSSTTPPTIESTTFNSNYLNKIIVPKGALEVYKVATNWSAFADYMEEATE